MKYIAYNDQGKTIGAYIQEPAHDLYVEANDEQMAQWFNYKVVGGSLVLDPPAPIVVVPEEVTMRQARLALLEANMLDAVNTAISSAPQSAQIEWEYASTVERDSSLVQSMASALNLSDAQLDALFISAGGK